MKDAKSLQALIDALSEMFPSDETEDSVEDGKSKKITVVSVQKAKGLKIPKAKKSPEQEMELE